MEIDWADGDYGRTAAELAPCAEVLVAAAGIGPGDRILDVGCGTGNASMAAVERGAHVSAVDPSPGLVDMARARSDRAGAGVQVIVAAAGDLPYTDRAFDVVISCFAVIFSPDADAALGEMVRVAQPEGVVALTSWLPGGALGAAAGVLRSALPEAGDAPRPRWDEPEWIAGVLERVGAPGAVIERHTIPFAAPSAAGWFARQEADHPVWRAVRREVGETAWDDVRARSVAVLEEHNESIDGFLTTSGYAVIRSVRELGAAIG